VQCLFRTQSEGRGWQDGIAFDLRDHSLPDMQVVHPFSELDDLACYVGTEDGRVVEAEEVRFLQYPVDWIDGHVDDPYGDTAWRVKSGCISGCLVKRLSVGVVPFGGEL